MKIIEIYKTEEELAKRIDKLRNSENEKIDLNILTVKHLDNLSLDYNHRQFSEIDSQESLGEKVTDFLFGDDANSESLDLDFIKAYKEDIIKALEEENYILILNENNQ